MSVPRVLLDSMVPLLVLGAASEQRSAAQGLLARVAAGSVEAYASTEMIQEVVHHRLRVTSDRARAVQEAQDVAALVTVVAFDMRVLTTALDLIASTGVRGRDAVHAATAIVHGLPALVSLDPAFDGIPGVKRLSPDQVGWHP